MIFTIINDINKLLTSPFKVSRCSSGFPPFGRQPAEEFISFIFVFFVFFLVFFAYGRIINNCQGVSPHAPTPFVIQCFGLRINN